MNDEHDPRLSKLYRSTRNAEPGAALDERVLAQARRAARNKRRRWLLPLSTAAVVMVGLTVTLKMVDQEKHLPTVDDFAVEQEAPARMQERAPAAVQPQSQKPAAPPPELKKEKRLRVAPAEAKSAPEPSHAKPMSAPEVFDTTGIAEEGLAPLREEAVMGVQGAGPEQWLQAIEQLVEENRLEQAKSALLKFRQAWPDYPIPEKLQKLESTE